MRHAMPAGKKFDPLEELDAFFGSCEDIVARYGPRFDLTYVTKNFEQLTGLKRESILGIEVWKANDPHGLLEHWRRLMEKCVQNNQSQRSTIKIVRDEKGPSIFESSVNMALDAENSVRGFSIVMRKLSEDTIQQMHEERFRRQWDFLFKRWGRYMEYQIEDLGSAIENSLEELGKFVHADRCYLLSLEPDEENLKLEYDWCFQGLKSKKEFKHFLSFRHCGSSKSEDKDDIILVPNVKDLKVEDPKYATLMHQGIQAMMSIPLFIKGNCEGYVGVEFVRSRPEITNDDLELVRLYTDLLGLLMEKAEYEKERIISEKRFKQIVERAFAGIYILRNKRFEFANGLFCKLTGYSEDELKSGSFKLEDLVIYTDEHALKCIKERRAGDLSPKSYFVDVRCKDGSIKQLTVNTTGIIDKHGVYTLGIAFDESHSKMQQEELSEIIRSLEKRNMDLRHFAHMASHNLRSPLSNIKGLLEHVDKSALGSDLNQKLIESIGSCTESITGTLEDMLEIIRLENTEHQATQEIELQEVLDETLKQLGEDVAAAELELEVGFEVPKFHYYPSHVDSFVLNMLTNAMKYRHPNRSLHLRISSRRLNDQYLRLSFEDNGLGIDLNRHGHKLFKMYQRFHSQSEGRGIGLYLIKTQLERYGGQISIESEPNVGSTFHIDLLSPSSSAL